MSNELTQNWLLAFLRITYNWLCRIIHLFSKCTVYTVLVLNKDHQPCHFVRVTIENKTGFTDNHGFVNFSLKPNQYDVVVNYPKTNKPSSDCLDIISGVDFSQNPLVRIVLN